ncbi:MAG: hypothetical protein ACI8P9_003474 [Parasphingorhabdus sp.]
MPSVPQTPPAESTYLQIDPELWRQLAVASGRTVFCQSCQGVQINLLPNVSRAIVLDFNPETEEFLIAAQSPNEDTE